MILSVKFGCFVQAACGGKRLPTGPAGPDGGAGSGVGDGIRGWGDGIGG